MYYFQNIPKVLHVPLVEDMEFYVTYTAGCVYLCYGLKEQHRYPKNNKKIGFPPSLSNSLRIQITKLTKNPSTLTKQFVKISNKIQKFSTLYVLAKLNDLSFQVTLNLRLKVLAAAGGRGARMRCPGASQSLRLPSPCF